MSAVRKTVTVLFCDLVGSTAMGDSADPEVLQEQMSRYHAELRQILERHGGTVEKFIGDAAMAVFGIPQVHEDDALRAARAALEIREAVQRLALEVRIGINTGEVVTGTGEALVTGDAVNVAARLEQTAEAGKILLGEQTERLIRGAVSTEPVEPVELKGKAEPVPAYRLLELLGDVPAYTRLIEAPFVGREHELASLERALHTAIDARAPQLASVVGPPGIGKSRLVRELVEGAEARVLVGRCLSYGEGITYWPLQEMADQLGPLEAVVEDELARARIVAALGEGIASSEEIAWGFRRLFEALAQQKPLIVVLDDIHWGEPTLLDLIEYVAAFAQDAPLLLLCTARPELFELRPAWTTPKPNATLVMLEPLAEAQAETLVDELGGLPEQTKVRIVEAAEGNPLFVEQLVAHQAESGNGELEIPPTIQALLAARIDRLEPDERSVIERASVEGRLFHRGSVTELVPDQVRPEVGGHLLTLVRKELIRPDCSQLPGDDGYRFGHILIRDAAYDSIPKRLRADLHERFAGWIEERMGEQAPDEIIGYHLEHAYRFRVELGQGDERARTLALGAGRLLAEAGRRALARADMPAAANLLSRAAALLTKDDPRRLEWMIDLSLSLIEIGELERAEQLLGETIEAATTGGDRRLEARASVELGFLRIHTDPERATDDLRREVQRAVSVFVEFGDDLGLARVWQLAGHAEFFDGCLAKSDAMYERALVHARRLADRREEARTMRWIASSMLWGPVPTDEATRRCEEILERTAGNRLVEANCHIRIAGLEGFQGRFAEARSRIAGARAILTEVGLSYFLAHSRDVAALIEMLAGDLSAAEAELRTSNDELQAMGEKQFLAENTGLLARVLYRQGRYEEAERFSLITEEAGSGRKGKAWWASPRAMVMARRGEFERAEELARQAVSIWADRDLLLWHGEALMDLAEVLRLAGRRPEAASYIRDAIGLFERKGILPEAQRARALLSELAPAA